MTRKDYITHASLLRKVLDVSREQSDPVIAAGMVKACALLADAFCQAAEAQNVKFDRKRFLDAVMGE